MLWTSALASSTILFLITLKPELSSSPVCPLFASDLYEKDPKILLFVLRRFLLDTVSDKLGFQCTYSILCIIISYFTAFIRCTIRKSLKLELRLRKPPKENWLEQVNCSVYYFLINSFRRVFMGLLCDPLIMHRSPSLSLSLAYHYIVSHTSMVQRQGMLFAKSNCQCASMQMENLVCEMQNKRVSARVHIHILRVHIRNRCELMPYLRRDN